MRKTAIIILTLALTVTMAAPALSFAEGKVGFVDFGKVLELTEKGAKVREKLAASKEQIEIQIQEKELKLRKMKEDLKTKQDVMAKEVYEAKVQEFQGLLMEYQKFVQTNEVKFEKMRVKLIRELVSDIEDVVAAVAKNNSFALVIMKFEDIITQSSIILYGDSSIDLTDKVIAKLNASK